MDINGNGAVWQAIYQFLLAVCYNVCNMHHFQADELQLAEISETRQRLRIAISSSMVICRMHLSTIGD